MTKLKNILIYIALIAITFLLSNFLVGWLCYDYKWIFKADRFALLLYVLVTGIFSIIPMSFTYLKLNE